MAVMTGDEAHALVEARLGRAPQDVLEAAVVLEAWGGVAAGDALSLADDLVAHSARFRPADPTEPYAVARRDRSLALGDVGFVLGVLFVGFWISSLASDLGAQGVDRAWRIALPMSLGAQWFLRRRYLSGPDGLGRLRAELWIMAVPAAVIAMLMLFLHPGGLMTGALVAIWLGGFLITRRGWGLWFGLGLVACAVLGKLGVVGPVPLITVAAVAAVVVSGAAILGAPRSQRRAGPWRRAVPAGLVGAGMGLLLVLEPRFSWQRAGWLPALTVIPSLVGSLWGGLHMTRLWEVMPQVLVSTSVRERHHGRIGRLASRLLGESLLRLVLGVALASGAVATWAIATDRKPLAIMRNLLLAHGALAVAGLCVALLEAFGRWGWALCATLLGAATAIWLDTVLDSSGQPGLRILAGAVVCVVASIGPLFLLLREPDRNLAAAL